MVEKQIELEVFSSHFERHLAANEGEADAQLNEEQAQVRQESAFEVALLRLRRKSQEIEVVGIFDELLCEIGLWRRESLVKVGRRLPCRR